MVKNTVKKWEHFIGKNKKDFSDVGLINVKVWFFFFFPRQQIKPVLKKEREK